MKRKKKNKTYVSKETRFITVNGIPPKASLSKASCLSSAHICVVKKSETILWSLIERPEGV